MATQPSTAWVPSPGRILQQKLLCPYLPNLRTTLRSHTVPGSSDLPLCSQIPTGSSVSSRQLPESRWSPWAHGSLTELRSNERLPEVNSMSSTKGDWQAKRQTDLTLLSVWGRQSLQSFLAKLSRFLCLQLCCCQHCTTGPFLFSVCYSTSAS